MLAEANWAKRQRCYKTSKKYQIPYLKGLYGNLKLRQFSTLLVEQFQTDKLKDGFKPSTINRYIATLKHMFTKAVDWDMVEDEVLEKIRRPKMLEENNKRLRFLSKEECQALIAACDDHMRAIVEAALNTGMRKREILNLNWSQVDLKHGFILLDNTKSGERREIPMNKTLKLTFQELFVNRRLDIPYVFFNPQTGKPYDDIKRSFYSACKSAGIKDYTFHDNRHTFASHLVMQGTDLTTVKELLGHKDIKMTLRYAHLAPTHKKNAVEMLDDTLNDNKSPQQTDKI